MRAKEFRTGRNLVARAEHNSDIIAFLTKLSKEQKMLLATFTAIGALKCAKLGFYDQEVHKYLEIQLAVPQEIACCIGNISLKEDEPFVHAHAVLVDQKGKVSAGHLLEGTVFAAEIHLFELLGKDVLRRKDALTGLSLWDL